MDGLKMKYFILNPNSKWSEDPIARASRMAMRAFASSIEDCNIGLAEALRDWAMKEDKIAGGMENVGKRSRNYSNAFCNCPSPAKEIGTRFVGCSKCMKLINK